MNEVSKNMCWIVFYFELGEFQIILEVFKLRKNPKSSNWSKRTRKKNSTKKLTTLCKTWGFLFLLSIFLFSTIFSNQIIEKILTNGWSFVKTDQKPMDNRSKTDIT